MAKGENQKLKLLYLLDMFREKTDETHMLTMEQIIRALEMQGISAERKSIYNDIEMLKLYGADICTQKEGRKYYYYMGSREFELPELKLLVDAVQSSKFITAKKSNDLIKKIENLASSHEAKQLQRQVFVSRRIKTMNESIYYNVDSIHTAIIENKEIKFRYFMWNEKKEKVLRHDGEYYMVSPWALTWDDENYYLVAYEEAENCIKHFRVDKMQEISIEETSRKGADQFKDFDMAVYAKKTFGMYGGEEKTIKLRFENNMAGIVIDRFGEDVALRKADDNHFYVNVDVALSNHFFGWIISLGKGVEIIGPDEVLEQFRQEIQRLSEMYM